MATSKQSFGARSFAVCTVALCLVAGSIPTFGQTTPPQEHKQRALDELAALNCAGAKPYVDMYREQVHDKKGPVVLELEKRLTLCFETDGKAKKLTEDLDLAMRTQQYGQAETVIKEFERQDKRAYKKYGQSISEAATTIEKYWQEVRTNIESALDRYEFQAARELLNESKVHLVGTDHPRTGFVQRLETRISEKEIEFKTNPR
ncbi:MAG: hypothetical protein HUU55_10770 [Myxococcales bacterium]|nr:hypothetical protein [Myxococcales bacterium]